MNTNQIKRFAQAARKKLIEQVGARLEYVLSTDSAELRERTDALKQLQIAINTLGKIQVIEKVAYTWFNRFVALRFMDVNDYQPTGIKVLTPKEGYILPEILEEAKHGHIHEDLPVKKSHIFEILDGIKPSVNPQNEAYKELLTGACNNLNNIFPFLFEKINDYTELLMPDDLISQYSIIQDVRNGMQSDDCKEVEIIGWLYQFYISEKKDEVFASKSAVKKEDIPAATQLFTPRWIVEYMVQNTLGKLWLQNRPKSKLRDYMPLYIESPATKTSDYLRVNTAEEIKLLDQACGSGHILVYGFDLFYKIYEEEGYSPSEIPQLIIEKNLHGYEIDERAAQLAGFAIMMKARSHHKRFLKKEVKPNIHCFLDLSLKADEIKNIFKEINIELPASLDYDLKLLNQATNFGSLIRPKITSDIIKTTLLKIDNNLTSTDIFLRPKLEELIIGLNQLNKLSEKYHCVVDNPPYMGSGKMNKLLSDFVKTNYPDSKADLMACFMEAGLYSLLPGGLLGMINQHSWMFLSSYGKLRAKLIDKIQFDTLLHLGPRTFPEIGGEVVQNASFTLINSAPWGNCTFVRLVDSENSELKKEKTIKAVQNPNCEWFYTTSQQNFKKIPGSPIGYWISKKMASIFSSNKGIVNIVEAKQGLATGNNERFFRLNWEVEFKKINFHCKCLSNTLDSYFKWYPINKGGEFRKWYGNQSYIVNWHNNGNELTLYKGSVIRNPSFYFKESISWSDVTSSRNSFRYYPEGFLFDGSGHSAFPLENKDLITLLGYLNNNVVNSFTKLLNPTLHFHVGYFNLLPLPSMLFNRDNKQFKYIVENNIKISKIDWDTRETSWNFKAFPLFDALLGDIEMASSQFFKSRIKSKIANGSTLEDAYDSYETIWRELFFRLHSNEVELNRQFIEIYGLEDELTPDVPLEEITILQEETSIENGELVFHKEEVLAQFVSYAVGCMFGRYSLDKPGLILANQGETLQDYLCNIGLKLEELSFVPDEDNIIPVLDNEWFEDDIIERFYAFLKASFGEANFSKNLSFIEESLGMDVRKYFTKNFYSDHIKRYKKRPIYWMFSSANGAFNVLIYLHRYTPDTLSHILNGYLREYKEKIRTHIEHLEHIIDTGSSSEATRATKQKDKYRAVLLELQEYERDILYPLATERIRINLDDGVLVNYNKFGKAIKEIAGLNDKVTKKKVKEFDWINKDEIR